MSSIITINNISISYDKAKTYVLKNVSANLLKSKMTVLLGPNGSGKSSILNAISGQLSLSAGEITYNGENIGDISIKNKSKRIAVVRTSLFDTGYMTVKELIEMGRYPHTSWTSSLSNKDKEIVKRVIEEMQIDPLVNKYIYELSDGEKQKAVIARALIQDTDIILLDEPTSFIDPIARIEILELLQKQCRNNNKSILYSSHDISAAVNYSDQIWLLDRDSKLKVGTSKDFVSDNSLLNAYSNGGYELSTDNIGFRKA